MTEQEQKYIFLKLTNGDSLMCMTDNDIDDLKKLKFLSITDPIQIFSFKMPHEGAVIEKYIMQAWTPFSSSNKMNIPINNIIFCGALKEFFIDKYMEYVTDPNGQQLLQEGNEEMLDDDEEGEQEMDEVSMLEEQIEQLQQSTKKWYH
jgi:hypothetical protein